MPASGEWGWIRFILFLARVRSTRAINCRKPGTVIDRDDELVHSSEKWSYPTRYASKRAVALQGSANVHKMLCRFRSGCSWRPCHVAWCELLSVDFIVHRGVCNNGGEGELRLQSRLVVSLLGMPAAEQPRLPSVGKAKCLVFLYLQS